MPTRAPISTPVNGFWCGLQGSGGLAHFHKFGAGHGALPVRMQAFNKSSTGKTLAPHRRNLTVLDRPLYFARWPKHLPDHPGAIDAISLALDGNARMDFLWSADGRAADFPENLGPTHEWEGLEECAGSQPRTPYANSWCSSDDHSAQCAALRRKL